MSKGIITLDELTDAHVLTAEIMGFKLDYEAKEILYTLQQVLECTVVGVKFILAQRIGDVPDKRIHLGIFFPAQTATVGAHVLASFMAGERDFSAFARNSSTLTYGAENLPRCRPTKKDPILHGSTIIGGGEINRNISQDVPFSITLEDNFGLSQVPLNHMPIVRRLVLQELGLPSI